MTAIIIMTSLKFLSQLLISKLITHFPGVVLRKKTIIVDISSTSLLGNFDSIADL